MKATGTGISVDLQTLCFNIKTCDLDVGAIVTNTTIEVQGQLLNGWRFEESRLDQQHWVAVALKINKTKISNVCWRGMLRGRRGNELVETSGTKLHILF